MKKNYILLNILIIIVLVIPVSVAYAKDNGVDDLRGRWDVEWELYGEEDHPPLLVLYINDLMKNPYMTDTYIAGGCMRSPDSDVFMPLSLSAVLDPENGTYEITIYSTVVPVEWEPFVIRFTGIVEVHGKGVPDDVAGGEIMTKMGTGQWNGTHHDRRRTKCPSVNGFDLGVQADVYAHKDLAYTTPRHYTLYEAHTVVVSSGMLVTEPDGSTMIVQEYTDIFSPDVDFIGRFRYLTHFEGMPISGGTYNFVLLDIYGNPIPGTESTDVWYGCEQLAPANLATSDAPDGDVLLAWDAVPDVPGQFEPGSDPPVGFYQIGVLPFQWDGEHDYGANGIKSPAHEIPILSFVPGDPGQPDGWDYGSPLSVFGDGLYQVQAEAFGEPLHPEGYGHECSVYNSAEQLVMNKQGSELSFEQVGTISGTVYESNGIDPIAYVHVDACSFDDTFCAGTETDADGNYTIILLPDKDYRVFVWGQPGWAGEVYQETIWWDQATPVLVGETGIDFTLEPGGSISGTVYDDQGTPLANIAVDIEDGGYGTCTDENGNYTLTGVPYGTYNVAAGRDFCEPHSYAEQTMFDIAIDTAMPDVDGIDFQLQTQPITLLLPYGSSFVGEISYEDYVAAADQLADLLSGYVGLPINLVVPEGDWITGQNTAIEGLQSGEIDLAFMSWAASLVAYDTAGAQPGLNVVRFGEAFYKSQILTHVESGVTDVQDLADRPLCWAEWYSVSGHMVPSWILEREGIDPHANAIYSDHQQVVWNLYNKECDGGGSYVDVRTDSSAGFPEDVMNVVFPIYVSPEIPNDGFIFRSDLPENVRYDLINAFMTVVGTPEGSALLNDLLGNYEGIQEFDFGLYQGLYDLIYQAGYNSQYVWDTYFNVGYSPTLHVVPAHPEIHGHNWNPDALVTIYVDDDDDLDNGILYEATKLVTDDNWCGDPCFDVSNVPELSEGILPGHIVTMMDDQAARVVHTTNLVWTGADVGAETVFGTAEPGTWVEVTSHGPEYAVRMVQADGDGNWVADFSAPGTEDFEQDVLDLEPGYHGRSIQFEGGVPDDGTLAYWNVEEPPQPNVVAHPDHEWVYGYGWTVGDSVTLCIDSILDGCSFTQTQTASPSGDPNDDPNIGEVWFDNWAPFDLTPDMFVTLQGGSFTRTLQVDALSVNIYDESGGIVGGTAPLGRDVGVGLHGPGIELWQVVLTDSSGYWEADFSENSVDFTLVEDIHAMIWDEDGDATQANFDFPPQ